MQNAGFYHDCKKHVPFLSLLLCVIMKVSRNRLPNWNLYSGINSMQFCRRRKGENKCMNF